jgi:hypothetical protein
LLTFCGQEGFAELWRRIKMEFTVEVSSSEAHRCRGPLPSNASTSHRAAFLDRPPQLPMLRQRWKIIVFGIVMQYVHGIFTQLAHRMHQPQEEPLHDVGFALTPVSEPCSNRRIKHAIEHPHEPLVPLVMPWTLHGLAAESTMQE